MTERETTSTTVPRTYQENYMIVLELFHSSTEALADEEEYFDISADSLESNCKRMKLDSCFESLSPGNRHNSSVESPHSAMAESPENPDELENSNERDADDNSWVFIVESIKPPSTESITSTVIADFLEQVREEDASSYFGIPPGPLKKVNVQLISPLNDLEKRTCTVATTPMIASQPRTPGCVNFLTRAALSQPAPGLACGCRPLKIGRGHGGNPRYPKSCFNWWI